jgi:hypothetical protein
MTWRDSPAYVRRLEAGAISIMRKVAAEYHNSVTLYSIGKGFEAHLLCISPANDGPVGATLVDIALPARFGWNSVNWLATYLRPRSRLHSLGRRILRLVH